MGVGSIFAMSPRAYSYFRGGSMKYKEWMCLAAVGLLS